MPISVTWEDRAACILRKSYWGTWTWAEFKVANRKIRTVVTAKETRVDVIVDARGTNFLAPDLIDTLRPYIETLNLNGGLNVVVGEWLLPDLIQVLKREIPRFGQLYAYTTSIERARAIIDADRTGRMWTDDLLPDILNE